MKRLFAMVYFAGMVAEVILRRPYVQMRRQNRITERRSHAAERVVLAAISLTMGLLPLTYALTRWLDFAEYRLSRPHRLRAGGTGSALLFGSVWLFWRAHRDLGANWSPSLEVADRQTLVTHGVYGSIRHPMYTSQLLWGLAQALLLPNWLAGTAGLAAFLALYFVRVPREERMMLDRFGDAYRVYSAQTGRILPRLAR